MSVDIASVDTGMSEPNAMADTAPIMTPEVSLGFGPPIGPNLERDLLIAQTVWPWSDLKAKNVPEQWLAMSRDILGTISVLAVQTSAGPKLVNASLNGSLVTTLPTVPSGIISSFASFNLTPASILILIAPPTGLAITLYSVVLQMQKLVPGGSVTLQQNPPLNPFYSFASDTNDPQIANFSGILLPVNAGIRIVNGAVSSVVGLINFYYTQQ